MHSILITGGASGIGLASARRFAQAGWRVGLLDRDAAALARAAGDTGAAFHRACDVCDATAVRIAIDEFAGTDAGGLDLLLLSHGVLTMGPFESLSVEQHRRTIDINVSGNIHCLLAAFPHLKRRAASHGRSQVISLCSASAVYGTPDFASYSASKFAVRALTEALQIEWAAHGIRVTDLMPPFVATPMVANQTYRPPILDRLGVDIGPDDVAETIWRQAHGGPTHRPVGWRFSLMYRLMALTPQVLLRRIYAALSR